MSNFQDVKGATIEEVKSKVAELGPGAKIVSMERVKQGPLGPLFAKTFYEALVDVPPARPAGPVEMSVQTRVGIAALLDDANQAEDAHAGRTTTFEQVIAKTEAVDAASPAAEAVGTYSPTPAVAPPTEPAAGTPAPRFRDNPGDLVLMVGQGKDAAQVVKAIAKENPNCTVAAGPGTAIRNKPNIATRRDAIALRAASIDTGTATVIAWSTDSPAWAERAATLGADQVWAVVDASRKPEDTRAWLAELAQRTAPVAVASINEHRTLTPETVNLLGVPVGWREFDGFEPGTA